MKTTRPQTWAARLLLLLFLLALPAVMQAADYTYTTSNGQLTITRYTGPGGAVVIPATINGRPVTRIGNWAFFDNSAITSVTIPTSVTSIGDYAFQGCPGLTGVYFQGQPPGLLTGPFEDANQATVYYLPGSTGWGSTYEGRPTALWLPQMRNVAARFGVPENQFGFEVSWAPRQKVVVEAATDLAAPVWSPVQTLTLTGDSIHFSDPQGTSQPGRFYRLRTP